MDDPRDMQGEAFMQAIDPLLPIGYENGERLSLPVTSALFDDHTQHVERLVSRRKSGIAGGLE